MFQYHSTIAMSIHFKNGSWLSSISTDNHISMHPAILKIDSTLSNNKTNSWRTPRSVCLNFLEVRWRETSWPIRKLNQLIHSQTGRLSIFRWTFENKWTELVSVVLDTDIWDGAFSYFILLSFKQREMLQ